MTPQEFINILGIQLVSKININPANSMVTIDSQYFTINLDTKYLVNNILEGSLILNIYGDIKYFDLNSQYFCNNIILQRIDLSFELRTFDDFNKIKLNEVPPIEFLNHIKQDIVVFKDKYIGLGEYNSYFLNISNRDSNKDSYKLGDNDVKNGSKILNKIMKELKV